MTATPSWGTCQVHATFRGQAGTLLEGGYKVTVPSRITNSTDDVIVPAGIFARGKLNTDPAARSFDMPVPANDDPDNRPNGWQIIIEFDFTDSNIKGEKYVINTPLNGVVNLREIVLPQTLPPPQPVLLVGHPGGIAGLDADGDVVDADGNKILSGGTAEPVGARVEVVPTLADAEALPPGTVVVVAG